jgi:site-specific DNA-methyltransferase (adenine-specific)
VTTTRLLLGDCLDVLKTLPDGSVDAVIADPPYGTTACKWDSVIPLEPLWAELRRLLRPRGAVVLTGMQPFTSTLVMSNPKWFRHCWAWDKGTISNFQLAKVMPLRAHEDVLVFSRAAARYRPQMTARDCPVDTSNWRRDGKPVPRAGSMMRIRSGNRKASQKVLTHFYPRSVLRINAAAGECNPTKRVHPTQKPVALMEYLVRTYTDGGDAVLDFCMGSGTTGIACLQTGRRFIGIERDPDYFRIAEKRLAAAGQAAPAAA